jgi:hypothetical protein
MNNNCLMRTCAPRHRRHAFKSVAPIEQGMVDVLVGATLMMFTATTVAGMACVVVTCLDATGCFGRRQQPASADTPNPSSRCRSWNAVMNPDGHLQIGMTPP